MCPTVILERKSALYLQGGAEALQQDGMSDKEVDEMDKDPKLKLIGRYMNTLDYEAAYENAKFTVYRVQ